MSTTPVNPDSTDIDRLHLAVQREKSDLEPGQQPVPVWLIIIGIIVAVIAGGQLSSTEVQFSLDSDPPALAAFVRDPRPVSEGGEVEGDPFEIAMKKGASSYAVCGGCHQGNGMGLAGQYPPLAGSEWVLGGTERLIRVVQHGLIGQITVKGQNYNFPGGMAGFGSGLSAADFAHLLTYIRNSWGNEASMVTKEMIEAVREAESARSSQWTEQELAPFADKDVPGEVAAAGNEVTAK